MSPQQHIVRAECARSRKSLQLMPVWNCCPHTLHSSSPIPAFLSILTDTELSWLQKRHAKVDGRGSFYETSWRSVTKFPRAGWSTGETNTFFLGGGFDDFFRFPCIRSTSSGSPCTDTRITDHSGRRVKSRGTDGGKLVQFISPRQAETSELAARLVPSNGALVSKLTAGARE